MDLVWKLSQLLFFRWRRNPATSIFRLFKETTFWEMYGLPSVICKPVNQAHNREQHKRERAFLKTNSSCNLNSSTSSETYKDAFSPCLRQKNVHKRLLWQFVFTLRPLLSIHGQFGVGDITYLFCIIPQIKNPHQNEMKWPWLVGLTTAADSACTW